VWSGSACCSLFHEAYTSVHVQLETIVVVQCAAQLQQHMRSWHTVFKRICCCWLRRYEVLEMDPGKRLVLSGLSEHHTQVRRTSRTPACIAH
jgi:hypothetical protein